MQIQPLHIPTSIRNSAFPLEKINISKIEGIQEGISLFEGVKMEDIRFLTKWFQVLNLARGCREQCTFCLRNALAPIKETANQINTILWDDLKRVTKGFSTLSERLGFNVLQGNSHITLFEDANLPVAKIKDSKGDIHNTREALQEIYEKLGLPLVLVTSGWAVNDMFSQKSAEELCSYIQNNPKSIKEFAISVNPFYSSTKEVYIEKVVNALKTFLPLFKNNIEIGSILLKYNYPNRINNHETAKSLYEEIYNRLKIITKSSLEGYESLNPKNVTRHDESNYIENKGRGQKFFLPEEVERNNKKLFVESFEWLTMNEEQKREHAYNFMTKNIDINGQVYLITPSEQLVETDIQLGYLNKGKTTARIHSDRMFKKF